jgi:hypothetical protein
MAAPVESHPEPAPSSWAMPSSSGSEDHNL